jgi:hypothetical protein
MSRQVSPSTSRPYAVLRVTRVWGPRGHANCHRRGDEPARAPRAHSAAADEALVETIRTVTDSPFHGEGYREDLGHGCARRHPHLKRRVRRLMRAHDLLAPGRSRPPPRGHHGTIRTERVDEMWATDLTSTLTGEGQAAIRLVDHASTECLGIHAARRATGSGAEPPSSGRAPASVPLARASRAGCAAPRSRQPVRRR